jgi:hypothetical protein
VHTGVDLEVDARRDPEVPGGGSHAVQARVGVHGRCEARGEGVLLRAGRKLRQHQDRRVDARLPKRQPFLHERDPEPGRAPG